MFTAGQKEILNRSGLKLKHLTEDAVIQIAGGNSGMLDVTLLSDDMLIEFIAVANALYRGGSSLMSDVLYDFRFLPELARRQPNHPFLLKVETEAAFEGKTVELPARMLSTDKAYSKDKIVQFAARVEKACNEIGVVFADVVFRATGKLDGFAAYDDGEHLYTRGDGRKGTDITRAFDRGLSVANGSQRGQGPGEIVLSIPYFEWNLAGLYDNTRNFIASVVKEHDLDAPVKKAIEDKAVVFYPFAALPAWEGAWAQLEVGFDEIVKQVRSAVEAYGVDGVVFEVVDAQIKEYMGATNHHWRWQIAMKENTQSAQTKVLAVKPQCSRNGRLTPVVEIEPTRLSGALISKATAHNYAIVKSKGLGTGAVVEIVRSGEVIPYIERVITPAEPAIPDKCPSCGSIDLAWDGDYMCCTNGLECPAQITNTIEHFFKTLGNVDGFAVATIEKMYDYGVRTIPQVYALTVEQFQVMGLGPKQSENLVSQLVRSRTEQIEDWRFLAAFGVFRLGTGNCEKLLSRFLLEDIFALSEEALIQVENFAEKTAEVVVHGLANIKDTFFQIYRLGFNLSRTPLTDQNGGSAVKSAIAGQLVVFTGKMRGSRGEMEKQAKALGAKVGSAVSSKTNLLVTGESVGATKLDSARSKGVKIVTEAEYLELLER